MEVTRKDLAQGQVELTIEVSTDELAPFRTQALAVLRRDVEVPGFRRGRAPEDQVVQKVGAMKVMQEAAQLAVEKTLAQALKDEAIDPVGAPEISLQKIAPDNPLVYSAIVSVLPSVELPNMESISVQQEAKEVTDAEIDKMLENLRQSRATEARVERTAADGDKIEVDLDVLQEGVPIESGAAKKYPVVLGAATMIPGFEEQLVGLKVGEKKSFMLPFPKEYHNKAVAGKNAEFKVTVLGVYARTLPALDDAFAKSIGDFTTVGALKEKIAENLKMEFAQGAAAKAEQDMFERLVHDTKFGAVPEVLVTRESQTMLRELEENVARQSLGFDDYLQHMKKTRDQLLIEFAPKATQRVKAALLLREVAVKEGLEPSADEIKETIERHKTMYQSNEDMLGNLETPAYRDYVATILRNQKAVDWMKDKVIKQA